MNYRIEPPSRPAGRRILTAAQMRSTDAFAIDQLGVPGVALMENAGRHVACAVAERLDGGRVAILIGAGNNGGDGSVAARHLAAWGYLPTLYLACPSSAPAGDARIMLDAARAAGVPISTVESLPDRPQVVVDGLLGTGLKGAVRGDAAKAIAWINDCGAPVIAIDIPSGLCADTGRALGVAVRATETVTFVASAPGHWLYPGAGCVGRLRIVDIGMPPVALGAQPGARADILTDADLIPAFAPRAAITHKGSAGSVFAWAGSVGRTGAARMTLEAAMRAGAGTTTLAIDREALPLVAPSLCESMYLRLPMLNRAGWMADQANQRSAAVIGPGMPSGTETGIDLRTALAQITVPVVLDADGLNHHAGQADTIKAAVITPHPGEAARLLDCTTAEVQADRFGAVRLLAERSKSVTVLKGAHTLIALPEGAVGVCPAGNAGMATAGMGDVLAGIIGALLARGLDPWAAARAGVLWHARVGDAVAAKMGPLALTARDVVAQLGPYSLEFCNAGSSTGARLEGVWHG
ncbi:MAG: hydroxyethylthiazole kinase-like uncharacterized protein yjeF [Bradymonadia bacterium]|jgi:hydroxyethylthiazole kinase-like uncharacterized protein yjeF